MIYLLLVLAIIYLKRIEIPLWKNKTIFVNIPNELIIIPYELQPYELDQVINM